MNKKNPQIKRVKKALTDKFEIIPEYNPIMAQTNQVINPGIDLVDSVIKLYIKKEDEIFISALRYFANPPIKGEITKGKLKWRNITLLQTGFGFEMTKQLFQRGIPISPKITMKQIY